MEKSVKIFVLLITFFAGVSVSSLNLDDNYFFYEFSSGVESGDLNHVRLKREATTESSVSTTKSTPKSVSSTTFAPKEPEQPAANVDSVETNEVKGDRSRGNIFVNESATLLKDIVDVPEKTFNSTLESHIKNRFNLTKEHHKYYNSTFASFNHTWVNLEEWNRTNPGSVIEHSMLSKSHRRAATVSLKFKFPFYGHFVENITIATGGFLYTGEYVHSWLAATQYIAPLMANFDTSQMDNATVRYADNGTSLVVEWGNVYLQGKNSDNLVEGPFTFQAILHTNGDIVFAYKSIPVTITSITDEEHPVKVGLSDAYIIERTIFFVRRKTIYEYHRVNMKDEEISNFTAIYLRALPTCNMKLTCSECLKLRVNEDGRDLQCMWCPIAKLCSDGLDRNRQMWLKRSCDSERIHLKGEVADCALAENRGNKFGQGDDDYEVKNPADDYDGSYSHPSGEQEKFKKKPTAKVHTAAIASIFIVIVLVTTVCGWFCYAYLFPHSWSGQLLIKYRPSRWHWRGWRRGEARYTAASIHM